MIPDFPHNIRFVQLFFCCALILLCLCPVGCFCLAFLHWDSQQGRNLATSGHNKQKFQLGQCYSYIMRKVWYHQIWIQNDFGFMVLILTYIPSSLWCDMYISTASFWQNLHLLKLILHLTKKMDYCLKITRNSFVSKYSVPATVCIFTEFDYVYPTHH